MSKRDSDEGTIGILNNRRIEIQKHSTRVVISECRVVLVLIMMMMRRRRRITSTLMRPMLMLWLLRRRVFEREYSVFLPIGERDRLERWIRLV